MTLPSTQNDFLLLIISSPSGAGKTTLCRKLLKEFNEMMFSISHTTRSPRANEIEGKDYHFVNISTFQKMIDRGEFAEWAKVHGNLYGTSLTEIERCRESGLKGILFDIDYQGARQIKAAQPNAVSIFVLPPSIEELKRRLLSRGAEDKTTIETRFGNAKREIEHYGFFDYLIVNDDLDEAYSHLRSIIHAEGSKRWKLAPLAEKLLREIKK